MSSHVWYVGEYSVGAGKTDTFKSLIERAAQTEYSDKGVLNYEFFSSEDESTFCAIELFRDSEAVLRHIERAKDVIPQLLEIAKITRCELFGSPNAAVRDALASFGPTIHGFYAGFTRLQSAPIP